MKALLQRVSQANVIIDESEVANIGSGILLFIGIEKDDDGAIIDKMIDKILKYRIFSDQLGKMNLSITDIAGEILVVSQFTLVAQTNKGTRPGFSKGASPEQGEKIYNDFLTKIKQKHLHIASGVFGADMKVGLVNDGPVTFLFEIN